MLYAYISDRNCEIFYLSMTNETICVLPAELWDSIMLHLSTEDLIKMKLVSYYFLKIIKFNRFLTCRILVYNKRNNDTVPGQFRWIASSGDLEISKWFYVTFNVPKEIKFSDMIETFSLVASRRFPGFAGESSPARLEVLRWIHSIFNLTRATINGDVIRNIFQRIAENGHLEIGMWLKDTFQITERDILSDDNYSFKVAAANGHLKILQWLHSTFNLPKEDVCRGDDSAFILAIENRSLNCAEKSGDKVSGVDILKWLHSTFNLTGGDAGSNDNLAFRLAGARGDLDILKWLHSTFDLELEDQILDTLCNIISNYHLEALQWVCSTFSLEKADIIYYALPQLSISTYPKLHSGKANILEWLCSAFNITKEDIKNDPNYIIRWAAWMGNLEILELYRSKFNLTREDMGENTGSLLRGTICGITPGHVGDRERPEEPNFDQLKTLKYLYSAFNLKVEDIIEYDYRAFRWGAAYGGIQVLDWLYSTFDLPEGHSKEMKNVENKNSIFRCAIWNGHLKVLKWLHSNFTLTIKDIRSDNNYAFRIAAENNYLDILKWLHCTFNLTTEDIRSKNNYAINMAAQNLNREVFEWINSVVNP